MKKLLVPIALLVIITVIWLIQSNSEQKGMRGDKIENFLNIDSEKLTKIEIIKENETNILYKKDGLWYIESDNGERLADNASINLIVENSAKINVGSPISSNPDKQIEFMVDDSSGLKVNFYEDDKLTGSAIMGKSNSRRTHTYIRLPDSDNVYEADGPISYVYGRPFVGWLDKTILSIQSGAIKSITIEHDSRVKLTRDSASWTVSKYPFNSNITPVEEPAVDSYVGMIIDIQAVDFLNAADSGFVDFENLSLRLNIELFTGESHELKFSNLNEENSRVYVRRTGLDETFVIRKSKFSNYLKKYDYFVAKN